MNGRCWKPYWKVVKTSCWCTALGKNKFICRYKIVCITYIHTCTCTCITFSYLSPFFRPEGEGLKQILRFFFPRVKETYFLNVQLNKFRCQYANDGISSDIQHIKTFWPISTTTILLWSIRLMNCHENKPQVSCWNKLTSIIAQHLYTLRAVHKQYKLYVKMQLGNLCFEKWSKA